MYRVGTQQAVYGKTRGHAQAWAAATLQSRNPLLWLDASADQSADGAAESPAMHVASAAQTNASKRPTLDGDGWSATGGPCYDFDGVDDDWQCGSAVNLSGMDAAAIVASCSFDPTTTTGILWEYTASATGNNGVYAAFRRDGGQDHPFGVLGVNGGNYSGRYISGDYANEEGVLVASYDRAGGSQDAEIDLRWQGSSDNTDQGSATVSGNFDAGADSWIGARNNGSLYWKGKIRELLVYGGFDAFGADLLTAIERAAQHRAGKL